MHSRVYQTGGLDTRECVLSSHLCTPALSTGPSTEMPLHCPGRLAPSMCLMTCLALGMERESRTWPGLWWALDPTQAAWREQLTVHCDEHTDKLLGTHREKICLGRDSQSFRKKVPLEVGLEEVFTKKDSKQNSPIDIFTIEVRLKTTVFSEQRFWALIVSLLFYSHVILGMLLICVPISHVLNDNDTNNIPLKTSVRIT